VLVPQALLEGAAPRERELRRFGLSGLEDYEQQLRLLQLQVRLLWPGGHHARRLRPDTPHPPPRLLLLRQGCGRRLQRRWLQ
jgi:hypothetical protein